MSRLIETCRDSHYHHKLYLFSVITLSFRFLNQRSLSCACQY
jgi:hypothetical protein